MIDTERLLFDGRLGTQRVRNLTSALRAEWTDADAPMDPVELLAAKYRGDSAATTGLRTWLTAHGIPCRFTIV